jgi:hypothetical protein
VHREGEEGLGAAKPREVRPEQGCCKGPARARCRVSPTAWCVHAEQGDMGRGKSPIAGPVGGRRRDTPPCGGASLPSGVEQGRGEKREGG